MNKSSSTPFTWQGQWIEPDEMRQWEIPMVEIFETVEGEGLKAGVPTIFVRVFHCNLRCTWCDTPYSYAPAKPAFEASIAQIINQVQQFASRSVCLTGGEPLIHQAKSAALIHQLAELEQVDDIHIETNGAIDIQPFAEIRANQQRWQAKVRFVMDYKLPDSGEMDRMINTNFQYLDPQDEIKFVIGSHQDFELAKEVIQHRHRKGQVLMSPVWETMPPKKLVEKVLADKLSHVKISLQLHKIIWDPDQRGV